MPAERVSMRRVREILRLKYECGASDRAIARRGRVARSTVSLCLDRMAAAGLNWPLPASLTDEALEALLFAPAGGSHAGARRKEEPDWAAIHRELRRPGRDAELLWEEYRVGHADRLRLQPLVRTLPGLGGPAVADHAPGASGR